MSRDEPLSDADVLARLKAYQSNYLGIGRIAGLAALIIERQQAELDALRRASAPAERVPTYCWNGLGFGPDMSK